MGRADGQAGRVGGRVGGAGRRVMGWAGRQTGGTCTRVPAGAGGFQRVPAGAGGFQRVPAGSSGCRCIPAGSGGCRRIPVGSGGFRRVPVGSGGLGSDRGRHGAGLCGQCRAGRRTKATTPTPPVKILEVQGSARQAPGQAPASPQATKYGFTPLFNSNIIKSRCDTMKRPNGV